MIVSVSSGRRFGGLAEYLATGRSGQESERVAWTAGRNISTADPIRAGKIMQAEAALAVRVEKPVYHVALAFDPSDPVTPEIMRRAADRLLADLGLSEHQAIIVAHQDRAHPHVHIMVNRVHPETGIGWDRSFDYQRIEESLRAQERELGLRIVPGHHAPTALETGQGTSTQKGSPERSKWEERLTRRGDVAFVDRVRSELTDLRAATSWADLHDRLAARGLALSRKGQGLVIVEADQRSGDGAAVPREVKASRVHRELSLRALERRFGSEYVVPDEKLLFGIPRGVGAVQVHSRRGGVRADAPLFRVSARAAVADIRQSQSWNEVSRQLELRGMRLDRSGYGISVTDGLARVWLSDLGRNVGRTSLEERFGQSFADWSRTREREFFGVIAAPKQGRLEQRAVPQEARLALSRSARYLGVQISRYDQIRRLDQLVSRVTEDTSRIAAGRQVLNGRIASATRTEEDLRGGFARVYRDSGAAWAQFRELATRGGVAGAGAMLAARPEQFGRLKGAPLASAEPLKGLRIMLSPTPDAARGDPRVLASAQRAAVNLAHQVEGWGAAQRNRPSAQDMARAEQWEGRSRGRETKLRAQYAKLGTEAGIAQRIASVLPRVTGEELARLLEGMRPEQRGVLRTFLAAQHETANAQPIRAKKGDDYQWRGFAGEIARATLRQLLPKELRQVQMAVEVVHSPIKALQSALKGALKRELLGQGGTER